MLATKYFNSRALITKELRTLANVQNLDYIYNLDSIQRKLLNKNIVLSKQQLHYFDDSIINPLNYYPKAKKHAIHLVHSLKRHLFMYKGITWDSKLYFYNLLITSSNHNYSTTGNSDTDYRLIDANSNKNTFLELHSALSKLRNNYLKHKHVFIFSDNVVDKFNPISIHNPHVHGILVTDNAVNIARISSGIKNYVSKQLNYDINTNTKLITPLTYSDSNKQVVISSSNLTDDSIYNSIQQDLIYQSKSNILALSTKSRDVETYSHMNDFDKHGAEKYVFGAINSATKLSGGRCINKHKAESNQNILPRFTQVKRYKVRTHYTCNLNKFNLLITHQTSLFDLAKVDDNQNINYYRYNNRASIGGTSEHYGWFDYYNQELHNENRDAPQNKPNTQQLTLIPIKNSSRDIKNDNTANYQRAIQIVSHTPLKAIYGEKHSLTITFTAWGASYVEPFLKIEQNKKLKLFNSS